MNDSQTNKLLSALPEKESRGLRNGLELVQLPLDEVLLASYQKPKFLYFPLQGVVSLISQMSDGSTTEIGLIGDEGMVGTLQFIGQGVCNSYSVVQAKGTAMRIEAEVLQAEFDRSKMLQKILLGYALMLFNQVSQVAACNNHHTVKQRTARWLLMLDDRHHQDEETLPMTQQLLSRMLGVRRTGVTEAAKQMQQEGIIDYQRGKIEILNRQALEKVACECYQVLKI